MNHHLKKNCEGVDASVFSGDVLYDDDSRAELKDYIGRWTRAIAEHERAAVEAALLAPQQAEPTCYKHDEPRKGCTWCDKQSPSAPTAVEPVIKDCLTTAAAVEHKPLFGEMIAQHPGLREEMLAESTGKDSLAVDPDERRYQLLRRGQHWSVIDGVGNVLRGDDLDAAVDSILTARASKGTK